MLCTAPCQLFYVNGSPSNSYLGQYYKLQDDTFLNNTSPVYAIRSNSSVWLFYNFNTGRWELADRISDVNVVLYAYSNNTSDYDAPPAVSDWTFPVENTTVFGVTSTCTCKQLCSEFLCLQSVGPIRSVWSK